MKKELHPNLETNEKKTQTIIFDEETHNNRKEFEKLQNKVKEALGEEKTKELMQVNFKTIIKTLIFIPIFILLPSIVLIYFTKLFIAHYQNYDIFYAPIHNILFISEAISIFTIILNSCLFYYFGKLFVKGKYENWADFLRAKSLKHVTGYNKLSFESNLQNHKEWIEENIDSVKNSEKNIVKKLIIKYMIVPFGISMLFVLCLVFGENVYLNNSINKDFKMLGFSQEQIMDIKQLPNNQKRMTILVMKNRLFQSYAKKYGEKCGFEANDLGRLYFGQLKPSFQDPIDFVKGKCSHKAVDSVYNTYDPDKAVKELGYELIPDDQDIKLQEIRKYKEELKQKEEAEKAEKE